MYYGKVTLPIRRYECLDSGKRLLEKEQKSGVIPISDNFIEYQINQIKLYISVNILKKNTIYMADYEYLQRSTFII